MRNEAAIEQGLSRLEEIEKSTASQKPKKITKRVKGLGSAAGQTHKVKSMQ